MRKSFYKCYCLNYRYLLEVRRGRKETIKFISYILLSPYWREKLTTANCFTFICILYVINLSMVQKHKVAGQSVWGAFSWRQYNSNFGYWAKINNRSWCLFTHSHATFNFPHREYYQFNIANLPRPYKTIVIWQE